MTVIITVYLFIGISGTAILSDSATPRRSKVDQQERSSIASCLNASPDEFYYKVAPLALDLRADTLTRSARGSLSRLTRTGGKLAFSDDEDQSKSLRNSRDFITGK